MFLKKEKKQSKNQVLVYAWNPSTVKIETSQFLGLASQPGLAYLAIPKLVEDPAF